MNEAGGKNAWKLTVEIVVTHNNKPYNSHTEIRESHEADGLLGFFHTIRSLCFYWPTQEDNAKSKGGQP